VLCKEKEGKIKGKALQRKERVRNRKNLKEKG
jgi:hypothetical protein